MPERERGVERRKESEAEKERVRKTKSESEAGRESVYRRRHFPRCRRTSKRQSPEKDPSSRVTDDVDRNEEEGDNGQGAPSSTKKKDLLAELRRKDRLILRTRKKYVELEKYNRELKEACRRSSRLLEEREEAYRRLCSRYDESTSFLREVERSKAESLAINRKLKMEITRRDEDTALLKSIVYRLNSELERRQVWPKERAGDVALEETDTEETKIERAWGCVDFHALGPLLNAYDVSLMEKCRLIARYEREMTHVDDKCKDLLEENDRMHAEVEDLRSKCDRYAKETDGLVESIRSLKRQNDSLAKEAEDRKRELQDVRWSYERKIGSIVERNEALRKESVSCTAELSNLQGKYDALCEEVRAARKQKVEAVPVRIHTAAIDECNRLFEELKDRHEAEKRTLVTRLESIEKRQPENEEQLAAVTSERNHLETLTKILEKKLKQAQSKLERARRVACAARISRETIREQLLQISAYCEELFAEYERVAAEREKLAGVLHETERENADLDRAGKSIARRVDGLRDQLRIVQRAAKQRVATIEKRIKIQEHRVDRVKRKYRGKVRRLAKMIEQKENLIGRLRRDKCKGEDVPEKTEQRRLVARKNEEELVSDSVSPTRNKPNPPPSSA